MKSEFTQDSLVMLKVTIDGGTSWVHALFFCDMNIGPGYEESFIKRFEKTDTTVQQERREYLQVGDAELVQTADIRLPTAAELKDFGKLRRGQS